MKKETVTFTYSSCSECPWCDLFICTYQGIGHKVGNIYSIPTWCQLEDADEE